MTRETGFDLHPSRLSAGLSAFEACMARGASPTETIREIWEAMVSSVRSRGRPVAAPVGDDAAFHKEMSECGYTPYRMKKVYGGSTEYWAAMNRRIKQEKAGR